MSPDEITPRVSSIMAPAGVTRVSAMPRMALDTYDVLSKYRLSESMNEWDPLSRSHPFG